jgi:regulatory protein
MVRAGYLEEEVHRTLDYLDERRYLDDAVFARDFARARAERKLWGPGRIERRLRELFVRDADIAAALEEAFPVGEGEAARRALDRLLRREGKGGGLRGRARAYRHLIARGFAPDVVHRLVSGHDFGDTDAYE